MPIYFLNLRQACTIFYIPNHGAGKLTFSEVIFH
jgi:hypothetical protein